MRRAINLFFLDEAVEFAPFVRVIDRPELYHLKRIQLVGYMNLEFEGNALYRSEDQFLRGGWADALWIDVEAMKVKPPFARGWVIVEGTFNGKRRGHFGMFAGTLEAITRLQPWRGAASNSRLQRTRCRSLATPAILPVS